MDECNQALLTGDVFSLVKNALLPMSLGHKKASSIYPDSFE